MKGLINVLDNVIVNWNKNCTTNNIKQEYFLEFKERNKKYYINKFEYIEKPICELSLFTKGDKNLLLWRREYEIPKGKLGMSKETFSSEIKDELYHALCYEMFGCFSVATEQFIVSQDYAEYDLENDRLKQHESAKGMVVQAIDDGAWFKKGDSFDVFMEGDDAYFIYTQHLVGRQNNGIAKVVKDKFMIVKDKEQSIILLDNLK